MGEYAIFKPFCDTHSIEQVGFIINLSEPICSDLNDLVPILRKNEQLIHFLPKMVTKKIVKRSIGKEKDEDQISIDSISFKKEGQILEWELTILKKHIIIYCFDYTRWMHIWPTAYKIIMLIKDLLLKNEVESVLLGFLDTFNIIPQSNMDAEIILPNLLREKSEILPPILFNSDGFLNFSTNVISKYNNVNFKHKLTCLNNIKIFFDCTKVKSSYKIDNSFKVRLRSKNNPKKKYSFNWLVSKRKKSISPIETIMDDLHQKNVCVLNDILNDEMLKAIGMSKGDK